MSMVISKDIISHIYIMGVKCRCLQPVDLIHLKQTCKYFRNLVDNHMWPLVSKIWYKKSMNLQQLLVFRACCRYGTNITLKIDHPNTNTNTCVLTASSYTVPPRGNSNVCVTLEFPFGETVLDPFPDTDSHVLDDFGRIYNTPYPYNSSDTGRSHKNSEAISHYLLRLLVEHGWYIYDTPSRAYLK